MRTPVLAAPADAVGIVINRDILRDTPIAAETAILMDLLSGNR